MEYFVTLLWFVFGIAILAYACIDFIKDNERGAAFWLFGWYGKILRPGFILKWPFAKIIKYTITPRDNLRISRSFITEPKSGFMVKTELDILLMFDPDATDINDFIKFHQVQKGLEETIWTRIKNFIDDQLRHAEEPTSDSDKTDEIKQLAEEEGHNFIKEYSGAGIIAFEEGWLKLDITDDAREAVQAAMIQEKYNLQQELAQKQFDAMVTQMMGENEEMTRKEAVIAVLNRMDKASNLSDQTWNFPGVPEALAKILVKASSSKESK